MYMYHTSTNTRYCSYQCCTWHKNHIHTSHTVPGMFLYTWYYYCWLQQKKFCVYSVYVPMYPGRCGMLVLTHVFVQWFWFTWRYIYIHTDWGLVRMQGQQQAAVTHRALSRRDVTRLTMQYSSINSSRRSCFICTYVALTCFTTWCASDKLMGLCMSP